MKIKGEHTFKAPRAAVWDALMDPDMLAQALPGGEKLEKVGENDYKATMKIKVGPVQGKFDGGIQLSNIEELTSYHMDVNGQGVPGFVKGGGDLTLSDSDEGTHMDYSGDVQVGGKIAGVGQRLIDTTARSLIRQGLQALDLQIQAKVAGEDGAELEAAIPSTAQIATSVAKDVAKETVDDVVSSVTGAFKRFTGGNSGSE